MTAYLLERRLDKRALVATLVVFFFLVNALKVPVYVWLGWIDVARLTESLLFCCAVPVGSFLGLLMLRRIPEKPFTLIVYAAAAAGGVRLIVSSLSS